MPRYYSVKEVVLPFNKFPESDIVLGPEMKSTGEVMGIDEDPGIAFAKAQLAAGTPLPTKGTVLITLNDSTKNKVVEVVKKLDSANFKIVATQGTYQFLKEQGIRVEKVMKIGQGSPNLIDFIKEQKIDLIFNTPLGKEARMHDKIIRQVLFTTIFLL